MRCRKTDALAFLMDVTSRSLLSERDVSRKKILKDEGHSRMVLVEENQIEDGISFVSKKMRKMVFKESKEPEAFLSSAPMTAAEVENVAGEVVNVARSVETKNLPGRRRSSMLMKEDKSVCCARIVEICENESMIEVLIRTPGKAESCSSEISEKHTKELQQRIPNLYDYRALEALQMKFQHWRPLNSLCESDGTAMGRMLMDNTSGLFNTKERSSKVSRARLKIFFSEFIAMKTLKGKQPWFETMLEAVIAGGGGAAGRKLAHMRDSKLELVEKADGTVFGVSFLYELSRAATEEGAFESWAKKHPAMKTFGEEEKWFESFMTAIGKVIRHTATWYKLGLSLGAAATSM